MKTRPSARTALTFAVASFTATALGCSSNSPAATFDARVVPAIDAAAPAIDAAGPPGFVPLLSRSWSLAAGATDIYRCTRIALAQDTTVTAFHAVAPFGTHHSVLTISTDQSAPLGDYDCNAGSLDSEMLFASGVGTDDLVFPADTGIIIPAGTLINLNLHLFNATDSAISGTSGVMIKTATSVTNHVDMTFGGSVQISIPNNDQSTDVVGTCTLTRDYNVFALWPHMHQIATHQKVQWVHGGTTDTVLDDDYSFLSQKNYPLDAPLVMHAGDQIITTCSYLNNEDHTVMFGESSTDEMCFTGIYRYPSGGSLFECFGGQL